MGTNYYVRYNRCGCCDRYDELHMCKSFHTYRAHRANSWDHKDVSPVGDIVTVADWLRLLELPGVEVWDEYDSPHHVPTVVERIKESVESSTNGYHATVDSYRRYGGSFVAEHWLDSDGYHMEPREFS